PPPLRRRPPPHLPPAHPRRARLADPPGGAHRPAGAVRLHRQLSTLTPGRRAVAPRQQPARRLGRHPPRRAYRAGRPRRRPPPPPAHAPRAPPPHQRRPARRRPGHHRLRPGPRGTRPPGSSALVGPRPGPSRRSRQLRRRTRRTQPPRRPPRTTPRAQPLTPGDDLVLLLSHRLRGAAAQRDWSAAGGVVGDRGLAGLAGAAAACLAVA